MKIRQRYTQFALESFQTMGELAVSLRQLVKQLNEQARDDQQIFNSLVEGELVAMDVTTNALPIRIPTAFGTPRGVVCAYIENITDTSDHVVAPQINWTYTAEANAVEIRAMSGLAADTTYKLVFLVLDGRARGDDQPILEF